MEKMCIRHRSLKTWIIFLFLVTLLASLSAAPAMADEDDNAGVFNKAADKFATDDEKKDARGFLNLADRSNNQDYTDEDARNTFGFVIRRLMSTYYMNSVTKAPKETQPPASGFECDLNDKKNGTPLYHNCDVPNVVTDVIQNIIGTVMPSGPKNANKRDAYVPEGFGLPSYIPDDEIPVDPKKREFKTTGLELFGYSMTYTSYLGEWDHISVMNSTRMLTNFGWADKTIMGAKAIGRGVQGAWNGAIEGAKNGSNLISSIGGFFSGFAKGGATATVNTLLDASDANVFSAHGWYRSGYGSTLYNARELTQEEKASKVRAMMQAIQNPHQKTVTVDPKLQQLKELDRDKLMPGQNGNPKCLIKGKDYKLDKLECLEKAKALKSTAKFTPRPKGDNTWDSYIKRITPVIKPALNMGSTCFKFDDAIKRKYNIRTPKGRRDLAEHLEQCWRGDNENGEYDSLANASRIKRSSNNSTAQAGNYSPEDLQKFFDEHPEHNVNAPWNMYVCTNAETHKDLHYLSTNGLVPLYLDQNGKIDPLCGQPRPPIQSGYFGNGYDVPYTAKHEAEPTPDTRYTAKRDHSGLTILFPWGEFGDPSLFANMGLNISKTTTKFTNTFVDLAFAPVLHKLGLDSMFIDLIGKFRDSVYFPFSIIIMAFAGLAALKNYLRTNNHRKTFLALFLVIIMFGIGVLALYKPDKLMEVVDEVPSKVETSAAGTVFSLGLDSDENLCTASSDSGKSVVDLNGKDTGFSPETAVRQMECEMWRTFVFNPWVSGQFGTTYSHLYANGKAPKGGEALKNKNKRLVGDAKVVMGGGATEHNWALYQLQTMTNGTATTRDDTAPSKGTVSPNFYRVVDVQAGPNGGANSDGRYFDTWNGKNGIYRSVVGGQSALTSVAGAIFVLVFSFTKIEVTFLSAMMLIFAPMVLLIGVHPTWGRGKLKKYSGTLVNLMIQRIFLTVMLAFVIRFVAIIGTSDAPYPIVSIITATICMIFVKNRKKIMELFTTPATKASDILSSAVERRLDQGKGLAVGSIAGGATTLIRGGHEKIDENGNAVHLTKIGAALKGRSPGNVMRSARTNAIIQARRKGGPSRISRIKSQSATLNNVRSTRKDIDEEISNVSLGKIKRINDYKQKNNIADGLKNTEALKRIDELRQKSERLTNERNTPKSVRTTGKFSRLDQKKIQRRQARYDQKIRRIKRKEKMYTSILSKEKNK